MFTYEKSITGKADIKKIWNLYSDVTKWSSWDESVKSVQLSGPFCAGTHGVMEMAYGPNLPIELTECSEKRSFTTKSELGPITVTFGHILKEDANGVTITHTVTIEGGEENQMKGMGEGITAGIPDCLQKLLSAQYGIMKFAECKNHKESIGLLFWQSSMLWQRKIKQILQSYNLTHTQFVILAVIEELSEQDICITQKRISDFSMIDVMTVSSTVRLLEKKGLIYRLPHKTDTRANSISNTEKGKICLKQAVIDVEGIDRTFFFNSDEENAQFKNMLSQLLSKNLE